MKKLSVAVVSIALIAFSLGYMVGGTVDRASNASEDLPQPNDPPQLTGPEQAESSEAKAHSRAGIDPRVADSPVTPSLDRKATLESTSSTPREVYAANKRRRLGDFFVINGVGTDRAQQIIQELIDADHYIVQKQNAMVDRHMAENADLIAQGIEVGISLTEEEKAELRADQERLYREIFGEYYEAHEEYDRSYPQRRVVRTFSSTLSEPLEYAAGEALVQIMYEENAERKSALLNAMAGLPEGDKTNMYSEQILATRSFNERVLGRARAYLTTSQFEQFKKLLDDDVRRSELIFELAEVDVAN